AIAATTCTPPPGSVAASRGPSRAGSCRAVTCACRVRGKGHVPARSRSQEDAWELAPARRVSREYRQGGRIPVPSLEENPVSRFHALAAALAGGLLFAGAVYADAARTTVKASITIEGKTIDLPHGRAFSTGMPYVLIYFAEKPLDGFKYGTVGNTGTWSGGA